MTQPPTVTLVTRGRGRQYRQHVGLTAGGKPSKGTPADKRKKGNKKKKGY